MHQYVPNILTVLITIFVSFVSSESKLLSLISGDRFLQCYGAGAVGMLDKDSGLVVGEWGGGNCIKYLKRRWSGKKGGKQKS